MRELMVDAAGVFDVAHALSNQAQELRDELNQLSNEWDGLSHSWSGVAASAFTPAWEKWREGATKLVEALVDRADRLGRAAVAYEEQDGDAAGSVGSAGAQM
ncbi:WXG100 family type VII secretion target [Mycobacterium sp.]|uniref:WXG100 family type VII secretion target n=1 Tax=Mycobacterium sp. TaxID=1785 RepID=UPI0031D250EC